MQILGLTFSHSKSSSESKSSSPTQNQTKTFTVLTREFRQQNANFVLVQKTTVHSAKSKPKSQPLKTSSALIGGGNYSGYMVLRLVSCAKTETETSSLQSGGLLVYV